MSVRPPPARKDWTRDAVNWYDALRKSPCAAAFQPVDWQVAKVAAYTLTRAQESDSEQHTALFLNRFQQLCKQLTAPAARLTGLDDIGGASSTPSGGKPQNVVPLKKRFG